MTTLTQAIRTRDELLALRDDPASFADLPLEEQRAYGLALRDLALEPDADPEALAALLPIVETGPTAELNGLALSFHPSARFSQVRYLEAEQLDAEARELFAPASPLVGAGLIAVFVDPRELTFRTFENIVPVDRLLPAASELSLGAPEPLGAAALEAFQLAARPDEALRAALEQLHALDLYVPPLNADTRGGKRMIFHSERLATALSAAVRDALPADRTAGFSHVNPVFRLNAFVPGDPPFASHRDTPYHDAARNHVSKLTLLLYLTGGEGDPALRIDELSLEAIAPWTCVVFPQRHEHEGRAYRAGEKVFLRTELIFEAADVEHDDGIAALFSRACYLTGEGQHTAGLSRYAADCYDKVAAAHWEGLRAGALEPRPFLLKRYRGVDFLTDGHDVWFRRHAVTLEQAAALAVLDHFNCKVAGEPFRARCERQVVEGRGDLAWVAETLPEPTELAEPALPAFDAEALLPEPEEPNDRLCCPFHNPWTAEEDLEAELKVLREDLGDEFDEEEHAPLPWDPTRCADVIMELEEAQDLTRERLETAPIVFLGEEIQLNRGAFRIVGDKLYLQGERPLKPINFAACWNYGGMPESYLGVDGELEAPRLLIPPIPFREVDDLLHLQLDFFRNGWMVRHEERRIPIPRIVRLAPDEADEQEESPWDLANAEAE